MNGLEVKVSLIKALEQTQLYYRQVNEELHLTRCPFCGDSDKTNKGHFYMKIPLDQNSPIVFHCAKCGIGKGKLFSSKVAEMMGINDTNVLQGLGSIKGAGPSRRIPVGREDLFFDYHLPEQLRYKRKLDYVRQRMGLRLTKEWASTCKVVTSIRDFFEYNEIVEYTSPDWVIDRLERDYIGFLSHGNTHLMLRDTTGNNKDYPWIVYPINAYSRKAKVFYTLANSIDIGTKEEIQVNIAEGVFDIIGVAYHLQKHGPNTISIANKGNEYTSMLDWLIQHGIYGSNVKIHIYSDNDALYNKKTNVKKRVKTEWRDYKETLHPYHDIFASIDVTYNLLEKDYGVPKELIALENHLL